MKRPVKVLQLPRVVADGFWVLVTGWVRCLRACGSESWPLIGALPCDGMPGSRGAERSRSERRRRPWGGQAGARQWCDQGRTVWRRAGWRRARRVGVACRGGIVAVATATLICACRDRRSVLRRMVPLTNHEDFGLDSARGGRSCGGERPGRPPARGKGHQLVISAQTKPASSRAIAVTATAAGLPRAVMVL
jgi:hypothetical protein